jgi:hypothetical protein
MSELKKTNGCSLWYRCYLIDPGHCKYFDANRGGVCKYYRSGPPALCKCPEAIKDTLRKEWAKDVGAEESARQSGLFEVGGKYWKRN